MTRRLLDWFPFKWRRLPQPDLLQAYYVTFSSPHGRMVLQDWLDEIYCQPCHMNDPQALAEHNAQRKFIHRVLEAIDAGEHPGKYENPVTEVMTYGERAH